MPKCKRGAPLGNQNALKHGRYSPRIKAERLAVVQAAFKEKQKRSDEWIQSQPKTDYDAICHGLRALAKKLGRR